MEDRSISWVTKFEVDMSWSAEIWTLFSSDELFYNNYKTGSMKNVWLEKIEKWIDFLI